MVVVVLGVAGSIVVAIIGIVGGLLIERYRRRNQVADTTVATKVQETVASKELDLETARFLVSEWKSLYESQGDEIRQLHGEVAVERGRVTDALAKHAECEGELVNVRRELGVVKRQMRDASRSLGDDGVVDS